MTDYLKLADEAAEINKTTIDRLGITQRLEQAVRELVLEADKAWHHNRMSIVERDEARAELAEEHALYLIRTEERDEARASLAEALEDVKRLRTRLENDASGRGY